jgi:hypothetical protein
MYACSVTIAKEPRREGEMDKWRDKWRDKKVETDNSIISDTTTETSRKLQSQEVECVFYSS